MVSLEPLPDAAQVLGELVRWTEAGWLRRLDLALARWLHQEQPEAPPELLLAAALLADREGRGHSCLVLAELLAAAREHRSGQPVARGAKGGRPSAAVGLGQLDLFADPPSQEDGAEPDEGSADAGCVPLEGWMDDSLDARDALRTLLNRLGADEARWVCEFTGCNAVDVGGPAALQGEAPLVFEAGRIYLRRHWREEQGVAAAVLARLVKRDGSGGLDGQAPDAGQVRFWLDRLFGPVAADAPADWQRMACAVALRCRLALITGGPGTGKTYTVARLLALVMALHPRPEGLRIVLAAPTGKAAARLKQSIDTALQGLRGVLPEPIAAALSAGRAAPAQTLHRLLGARPDTRRWAHDARRPLDVDLLVVDEASMVHLELLAALLQALPAHARLVMLGDKDQLASVEAGAVLADLCGEADAVRYDDVTANWIEACSGQRLSERFRAGPGAGTVSALAQQTVMLQESRRFQGAIGTLARAVNRGDVQQARDCLRGHASGRRDPGDDAEALQWLAPADPAGVVALAVEGRPGATGGYAGDGGYLRVMADGAALAHADAAAHLEWVRGVLAAFERFRLLCAVREGGWGVVDLNQDIEAALRKRGWIGLGIQAADATNEDAYATGSWYEGRPVMAIRNDRALGVFNGDVGVALRDPAVSGSGRRAGVLRVWFAQAEGLHSVLASRLAAVETAFAMTVHKSQGSEFDHTVLVLPPRTNAVLTRELVYTGITRARLRFTLVAPEVSVFEAAVRNRTRRASGLAARLQQTGPA